MAHVQYKFLKELDNQQLCYTLSRHRTDSVLISLTLLGRRIEIDVSVDRKLEMSQFSGDERVVDAADEILRIVKDASSA